MKERLMDKVIRKYGFESKRTIAIITIIDIIMWL